MEADEAVEYVEEGVFKLEELKHAGYITSEEENRRKELIMRYMDYQNQESDDVNDSDERICCADLFKYLQRWITNILAQISLFWVFICKWLFSITNRLISMQTQPSFRYNPVSVSIQ